MSPAPPRIAGLLRASVPAAFVFLWSTGWIVARFSADHADPLTFLSARFAFAGLAILAFALIARAGWPRSRADWLHALVSGVLLHGIYLGGVWWAIRQGLPASMSALIAAVQPILTALLAPALAGERIGRNQWIGLALGFAGIAIVLEPKLAGVGALGIAPVAVNLAAMASVTLGSFYQKRYVRSGDLRSIAGLQYAGALLFILPLAALVEPMRIEWNATMLAVMAWSVFGLSIGAIALYLLLIRSGEVSRAAQLIYLVPPTAAVQAWFFFGETFNAVQLAGMALTVAGVVLAGRR